MYSLKLLQFSLLESSPKRGYRKNGRLYSILVYFRRPNLYSMPLHSIFNIDSETHTKETTVCTLSNGSGPTSFGFLYEEVMTVLPGTPVY
jgi:hypothetical protein